VALVQAAVARAVDGLDGTHQIILDAPDQPVVVPLDEAAIDQVLTNLLDNALKYSPSGGEVTLKVRLTSHGASLAVRDGGIGLPRGETETIFTPFARATNATASHLPGMGLGLYICRNIVERHGGRIWAESPGEGQGTTINLWLPATPLLAEGTPNGR
jgi:signal transduction histidine kinase